MKKNLFLLASIPALLFTSCSTQKVDKSKIALDYGHYWNKTVTVSDFGELSYDELDNLISSTTVKSNFVLITFHSKTCGCYIDFMPVVEQFANEYHIDFKFFDVGNFEGHSNKFGIYSAEEAMPGICFFKRGKLVRQTIYSKVEENNRKIFKRYTNFKDYMLSNIYLPKMYYLDKEILDNKIANNETFNLYVSRTGCPDCGEIEEKLLKDWFESKKKTTVKDLLYIFDLAPYRGTDIYQDIKDMYGLSNAEGNEKFGYDDGYVPTFQRRTGSEVTDMITVLNDSVSVVADKYYMSSYFIETRIANSPMLKNTGDKYLFDGKELTSKQVKVVEWQGKTFYTFEDGVQLSLHKPVAELYLSTYVK